MKNGVILLEILIKIKVAKKDEDKVRRQIEIAHLDVEPWQAVALSSMTFLDVFIIGLFISVIALFFYSGNFPVLFFVLVMLSLLLLLLLC